MRPWPLSLKLGSLLSLIVVFTALLSGFWTPHDVTAVDIAAKLSAPSFAHPMGTDHFGRDVLSMIMVGAQNSLAVALMAIALGLGIGAPLGLWAAAKGGWLDDLVMRANDLVFAFPALLLAVMMTAVMGPGALNAILAIGIFNIPVFMRVTRAAAMALWTRDYVLAARTAGKSKALISIQHIAPNLLSLVMIQAAIQFSVAIVAEAGLSYVGLGTQPPMPSWGRMLAEAQTMTAFAPWLAINPGLAIFMTVLGLSLTGDGLRDLSDPRVRRERQS